MWKPKAKERHCSGAQNHQKMGVLQNVTAKLCTRVTWVMLLWLPEGQVLAKQQGPEEHFWRLTCIPMLERKNKHKSAQEKTVSIDTFYELSSWMEQGGSATREEPNAEGGVRGQGSLSPQVSRSPGTPSVTLYHWFPPWKAPEDSKLRNNRSSQISSQASAAAPESAEGQGHPSWKPSALASLWSSCESEFWHYLLHKILLLPTPSLCSHNISVGLKTTPLFHPECKM